MQATLYTTNITQKPRYCTKTPEKNSKKDTQPRRNTLNHTEDQNGEEKEKRRKSISEIKIRSLNVNGIGEQNKRDRTLKNKPEERWFHHSG